MFVHNCYAQPIYDTNVSAWCESLTDWSIPLSNQQTIGIEDTVTNTNPNDETTRYGAIVEDNQQIQYAEILKTMKRKAKYISHL